MEKVHILYLSYWPNSWFGRSYGTARFKQSLECNNSFYVKTTSFFLAHLLCSPNFSVIQKISVSVLILVRISPRVISFHFCSPDIEQLVSPVSVAHFSQYKLVKLLLKRLQTLSFNVVTPESSQGLNNWSVGGRELLMGHECVSIDTTDQLITVTTSYLKDGKCVERNIPCNILAGTDGAGSTIRKLVGINLQGETDLQKLVSVHFLSGELGQFLLNERPGMLFFIFNTEAIGVLVAHDLMQGEFVLQVTQTLGCF